MSEIKKFSFFKSYYDCVKNLKKNDRNEIINAILEYVFDDKTPIFSGIKKTIWILIEPTLKTSKNRSNSNAGAPLGNQNASKEKQSKNNQKTIKEQSNAILGIGIGNKDKDKEGERDILSPPHTPTEIFDYCSAIFKDCMFDDLEKSCKKMFKHYETKKWKDIYDWKSKAELWVQDDIDNGKIKIIDTSRRLE